MKNGDNFNRIWKYEIANGCRPVLTRIYIHIYIYDIRVVVVYAILRTSSRTSREWKKKRKRVSGGPEEFATSIVQSEQWLDQVRTLGLTA